MIKRILIGLGGTPYTTAEVRHALDLANAHNASITAVTIVDLERVSDVGPVPIGGAAAAAELVQHRLKVTEQAVQDAIATFREACADSNIDHHVITEAGDPFEELIDLWRYHDLTILALRSLFEYGVVQDPKDMIIQLLARGVRPILAVAPRYRPIKRVLIAYNGSMESAKAMKQLLTLRLWPDAEIQVVCADKSEDQARALLSDAEDYCQAHGYSPSVHFIHGDADDHLLSHAAKWQADLIVIGATARARIFRHILGDTALHLVTKSEIPLFMTQ